MGEIVLWKSNKLKANHSVKFLQGMIDRVTMGRLRYGKSKKGAMYLKRIGVALAQYQTTKNKEFLIDAANYCMLEFQKPSIPGTKYQPMDDGDKRELVAKVNWLTRKGD